MSRETPITLQARHVKFDSQSQQGKRMFDGVLGKTIHGITPVRFRAWLIKIPTAIKPGDPIL